MTRVRTRINEVKIPETDLEWGEKKEKESREELMMIPLTKQSRYDGTGATPPATSREYHFSRIDKV